MNPEKGLQLEGLVAKLCDLARCSPRTSYIKALCEESDQAITTLEAERDEAREQAADAKSTLSAWFDLAKKIEADALPTLADGFKGYLRTSMNGGMPTEMADAAKNAFDDYCRLYAGRDLVPVLRGMSEAALQASEAEREAQWHRDDAALQKTVIALQAAEAEVARLREGLEVANAAIWEFHRYMYGGETRGSYNGDVERKGLWKAGNSARALLTEDQPK